MLITNLTENGRLTSKVRLRLVRSITFTTIVACSSQMIECSLENIYQTLLFPDTFDKAYMRAVRGNSSCTHDLIALNIVWFVMIVN